MCLSLGFLSMSSGTINVIKTVAVNGPAVLESGFLDAMAGASINFNGDTNKGSGFTQSSSGTISYVNPGTWVLNMYVVRISRGLIAWFKLETVYS